MGNRALIEIDCTNAENLARALAPEVDEEMEGSTARISGHHGKLKVEIEARGLAPLRASVNSYLRWLQAAQSCADGARKWKDGDIP